MTALPLPFAIIQICSELFTNPKYARRSKLSTIPGREEVHQSSTVSHKLLHCSPGFMILICCETDEPLVDMDSRILQKQCCILLLYIFTVSGLTGNDILSLEAKVSSLLIISKQFSTGSIISAEERERQKYKTIPRSHNFIILPSLLFHAMLLTLSSGLYSGCNSIM